MLLEPSDVNSFQLVYLSNRSYICLAWRQHQIKMWGVHQVKLHLTINRIICDSVSCHILPCTFEPEQAPFQQHSARQLQRCIQLVDNYFSIGAETVHESQHLSSVQRHDRRNADMRLDTVFSFLKCAGCVCSQAEINTYILCAPTFARPYVFL